MERAELMALVRATGCAEDGVRGIADGPGAKMNAQRLLVNEGELGWLGVATGGTSGGVRWARHDEGTLGAAVGGFCEHFGIARVNAVGVLPAYHVSGLMARVRCAATGGEHVGWDWKRLETGERPELKLSGRGAEEGWVISLVPTQLQRLLGAPEAVAWLRGFKVIFVGGGPVWPELTDAAARAELRVALSYGMTETAAMVAALRPEEFLAGERSCGTAMPHARITVGAAGEVRVAGESVFRGYWPETRAEGEFETEDLGEIDARGHLRILGRRDAVIITGGKKVQPAEVEAALRACGEFGDVAVIGVPDAEWGEAVVACYPAGAREPDLAVVRRVVGERLEAAQRPKRYVAVAAWPRNAQGKVNRGALREAVARA